MTTEKDVKPWCLCDPGIGPHDEDCPAALRYREQTEKDVRWRMSMCLGESQEFIERAFTSVEAWELWLRENHPRVMTGWSSLDKPHWKQYGTDYYWSSLVYSPGKSGGQA